MENTARLVIDPVSRKISTKYEKIRLVQHDNNSTRVTFEMPRYVRGNDMSRCSTVEVHYDNISLDRKQKRSDVYVVNDIIVAPEDDETINFSWRVSRGATQIVGNLDFSLHFGCNEDSDLEYAWHTTPYSGIVVLEGKHNTPSVVEKHPDLVASILDYVDKKISEFDAVDIAQETGDSTEAVMSQKAVKDAIETVRKACDNAVLDERVSALEDAWEGNVSRFTTEDSEGVHHRVPSAVLPHAKLLRIGGKTRFSRNRLPEPLLTTCGSDTLRITWDEADTALVFNGTLSSGEELTLAHLYVPLPAGYHAIGAIHRGGTLTGGRPSVRFVDANNRALAVSAPYSGIASASRPFSMKDGSLSRVTLKASAPITFTDYKCNLFLYPEDGYEAGYDRAQTRHLPAAVPLSFRVLGANEWTGEREKQGVGSVLFTAEDDRFCEDLSLSFYADCDDLDARVVRVETTTADGETQAFSCPLRERASARLYSPTPFHSFSLTVIPSAGNTETPTLRVSDWQLERIEISEDSSAPYGEPMSYTLPLPSSFSRFADRFYGIAGVACNHLDFERGAFVEQVGRLTLDGSLAFLADETVPHRFYAEASLPVGIESAAYLPSAIFRAHGEGEAYDGCLWFSDGRIYLQNESFADADAVNAYFAAHPIDVLYTKKTELTLFDAEAPDFFDAPTVTVSPGAHLYCKASDGTLTPCFLRILYEASTKREVIV